MICSHITMHRQTEGAEGNCVNCKAPVIWTSGKWMWIHGLEPHRIKKLRRAYYLNRLREKAIVEVNEVPAT